MTYPQVFGSSLSRGSVMPVEHEPSQGGSFSAKSRPPCSGYTNNFQPLQIGAFNDAVFLQPVWSRALVTRGICAYVGALVDRESSGRLDSVRRDLLITHRASTLSKAEVDACFGIMIESASASAGEYVCGNTDIVQAVAHLTSNRFAEQSASAYRMVATLLRQIDASQSRVVDYSKRGSVEPFDEARSSLELIQLAVQVIVGMKSVGFSDSQIKLPRYSRIGLSIYKQDSTILGSSWAAVTFAVMGANEFNHVNIRVVRRMLCEGWIAQEISRHDVYAASLMLADGRIPSPSLLRSAFAVMQYKPGTPWISN